MPEFPSLPGYRPVPHIRIVHTWGEPDEDGVAYSKLHIEFDGERFPYMTSGAQAVHDLVPSHPEMGKVVYIPVVAASFEEVFTPGTDSVVIPPLASEDTA